MFVGVEAGGTKFVVASGTGPEDLSPPVRIPTMDPDRTMRATLAAIVDLIDRRAPSAIGVATFGPVDLRPTSNRYGRLIRTPKPGWDDTDVLGPLRALDVPIGLDTDVNGAALAEARWGAAVGLDAVVYITVGTGIGGGAIVGGVPLHGLLHPEMGHVFVRRHPDDDFPGRCSFHGDCLEGLASGPALEARWGGAAADLAGDEAVAELESWYLAQFVADVVLILSPQRIVLGGGVMHLPGLLESVQQRVPELLADYVPAAEITRGADRYIVAPALGDRAGVLGAIALAELALGPG